MPPSGFPKFSLNRRGFLAHAGSGLGAAALAALLAEARPNAALGAESSIRQPHFAPRAKRVVWLFMHGGPSHVDLFDHKPELKRLAGKTLPESFGQVSTRRKVAQNPLLPPVKPLRQRGEAGLYVSDFLPHLAEHADDLCVLRSLHGDSVNHPQSVYQVNTGSILMGKPSVGSWAAYGLGSENADLPAFVVLPDPGGGVKGGPPAWGNGYLPATYQGVTMRPGPAPILHLQPQIAAERQRGVLDLLRTMDQRRLAEDPADDELSARIRAHELAFRMQAAAPELTALESESAHTHAAYGLDDKDTRDFGQRCLLARRMLERGVRFVQVYAGDTGGWDAHSDVLTNHTQMCRRTDKPAAALLHDLKQRGLWEDTLVIWGGEFGRMPMSEQGKGRDHNPWGFTAWLAGGAVKGGLAFGETDPVGLRAAVNPVHVRDFHATLLHILGLDYSQLTFFRNGLEERLTGPQEAHIVREILA